MRSQGGPFGAVIVLEVDFVEAVGIWLTLCKVVPSGERPQRRAPVASTGEVDKPTRQIMCVRTERQVPYGGSRLDGPGDGKLTVGEFESFTRAEVRLLQSLSQVGRTGK